jgi:hypothetical protein
MIMKPNRQTINRTLKGEVFGPAGLNNEIKEKSREIIGITEFPVLNLTMTTIKVATARN